MKSQKGTLQGRFSIANDAPVAAVPKGAASRGTQRFRWREVLLSLSITILFSVLLYVRLDVDAFTSALADVHYELLAPVLLLHGLAWWFRALRWRTLLSPLKATPISRIFPIVMIGATVNSLVPGRIGEFWRAHALGRQQKLSRFTALGTIVVERALDGLVLALLACFAALAIGSSTSITVLIGSMALLFSAGLGLIVVLALSESARRTFIRAVTAVVPRRYRAFAEDKLGLFANGLDSLRNVRALSGAISITALTWVTDAAAYWMMGLAFGLDVSPQSYLLVVAVVNLAITVPFSVGGIGPYEFFAQQSLVLLGVSSSLALAYAVSIHGLTLAFVVVSGLAFVLAGGHGLSERRQPQPVLAPQD